MCCVMRSDGSRYSDDHITTEQQQRLQYLKRIEILFTVLEYILDFYTFYIRIT